MKKLSLSMLAMALCTVGLPQVTIKKIKDPHIRAQQDRMVVTKWGDFLPKPRNFLGINMNYHYTMTWSWGAPAQNRRYRSGPDIRPLGPTGQQTQRMALNTLLRSTSNRYREHSDSLARTALSEFYHHSGLFSSADPLWQLYYRRELRGLEDYSPGTAGNDLPADERDYLNETGIIPWFDGEMQRLQERLHGVFSADMDRGTRILGYHRIMKEYREVAGRWSSHVNWTAKLMALREVNSASGSADPTDGTVWKPQGDTELMRQILSEAKKLY